MRKGIGDPSRVVELYAIADGIAKPRADVGP
jgi:hypothetical protein